MATPSRADKMIRNLMALHEKPKVEIPKYDEEQEYNHLLWDKEHGQLSVHKNARFEELRLKYANK